MSIHRPEIIELLNSTEKKYTKTLKTSNDFNTFSFILKHHYNEFISASTLKRLWGYVNYPHRPRLQTLDSLSHYIGYTNFKTFCDSLNDKENNNSAFMSFPTILSKDLQIGEEIEIGWTPNRYVKLVYCGNLMYEVTEVRQSKLIKGDKFQATSFVLGQPLILSYILRDGKQTNPFIAGQRGGLTLLNPCNNG